MRLERMKLEHEELQMNSKLFSVVFGIFAHVRPALVLLTVFLLLLSLLNWLIVNQSVVLYLFYIPVIFAAWFLPKREAVSVATLAALLVGAFAFYLPHKVQLASADRILHWTELGIWGGILIVTAFMVSTLRTLTQEAMQNLQRAYSGVLAILSRFIQTVDADTEAHSARVSAWAVRIAKAMKLKPDFVEETRIGALLHDVGKVDISVDLLRKAAALSQDEADVIKGHATKGADIVKPIGGMLEHIAEAIESHHERYDGSGYKGLRGEDIPLIARIISVADAFDAMLSDRPYRKGVGLFEALDSIRAGSGTCFDPKVVNALKLVVDEGGERVAAEVASSNTAW